MTDALTVLFVCVHNAGRSQMAAGYLATLGGEGFHVLSAGTEPAESINPVVIEAMQEDGVDLRTRIPTPLRTERVQEADVV
ncbi:MAG TPA: heat-shock protein HtpX, partial [Actinomycetes bacterium]|nr:heat-shock protein HtpX [Actinomycetes bacterium]